MKASTVVGYQEITIPGNPSGTAYTLFTVTFKNPTTGVFPVRDIQVLDADGHVFDGVTYKSANKVKIQRIEGNTCAVSDATTYTFNSTILKDHTDPIGWHDQSKKTTTIDASVVVSNGVGFLVSNSQEADVKLRFSGEVEIAPMSFEIPYKTGGTAYAIFGNFTPTPISIKDIRVLNRDKNVFDGVTYKSANKVKIQKIKGNTCAVSDATTYTFNSTILKDHTDPIGWHDQNKKTTTLDASITLEPGESVLVSNSQEEPVYFQLLNPLTGEYSEIK